MTITMNDSRFESIAQIRAFIKVSQGIRFKGCSQKDKYQWIETTLLRFRYFSLRKRDKSILRRYLMRMTGYSDAQITRLIARKKKTGKIIVFSRMRHRFSRKYTPSDIALLIKTDNLHKRLSGPATKKILERECALFNQREYERLKDISASHIYNLRKKRQYVSHALTFRKTQTVSTPIGERRKPNPEGRLGYLRIDTVHQGNLDKERGVYHINLIDEISQWEVVGCVEGISEHYLRPLLKDCLDQFPFKIINFHSDNGGEFINRVVVRLLNKLLISQTKSRTRHCNDNALVEGKNGAVVRKHMGYVHIPKRYALAINSFYKDYFNVYLNYHRPCGFASVIIDKKGKERKRYDTYLTPYEAIRSHPGASFFLKEDVSFGKLDEISLKESDNEFAARMGKAKSEMFASFKIKSHKSQF